MTVMWWGASHGFWGMGMMIVFWAAIVMVLYWALRGSEDPDDRPSAREILDRRFATGELSSEEYTERRAALEGPAGTTTHPGAGGW